MQGRLYGYHRVSTKEQHDERGVVGITNYCEHERLLLSEIFVDKQTGKVYTRKDYDVLKRIIKPGDSLILWELDRLGRTKAGILNELRYFKESGIRVMSLDIPTTLMDFSNLKDDMARMMMEMVCNMIIEVYAALAEAELKRKKKRQMEGNEAKRARGEWDDYGRPAVMTLEEFGAQFEKVIAGKLTPKDCKALLNMKDSTYYRYKKRYLEALNQ